MDSHQLRTSSCKSVRTPSLVKASSIFRHHSSTSMSYQGWTLSRSKYPSMNSISYPWHFCQKNLLFSEKSVSLIFCFVSLRRLHASDHTNHIYHGFHLVSIANSWTRPGPFRIIVPFISYSKSYSLVQ
ncbi:hypothetical protein FOXG_20450 [Fusarium oxysporum f. sp. lycopersici 4287]|uniref:Uncharacterized protein n=1 Tax=Fusarium oxysporum f. sp. lycopersici (strain 4287 / CBS 123668 / FGSC 9935 / NRRL 34936) TaxID=426428 RepID=A0A0J9VIX6_FUSO4|nr:hypothetical protein FOXG_20450 [Fusarium oxysporum f. sp. lycopersici 4287]KNB11048.1 hypothetical protein FOXG_20450 [Fusarium oxysporum f. sp. lycopersici 4287]